MAHNNMVALAPMVCLVLFAIGCCFFVEIYDRDAESEYKKKYLSENQEKKKVKARNGFDGERADFCGFDD